MISASLSAVLDDVARALAAREAAPDLGAVGEALAAFDAALAALREAGVTRELPGEAVERIFGLAFGFEQLGRNLTELAGRVRELAQSS